MTTHQHSVQGQHVLVLGGGVIGVTSAWYLQQRGYQVTLVERQSSAAMETSHANAGQVSFGYSSPWAAPGVPMKAIKWLLQTHAPLKIKPSLQGRQWRWMLQMLSMCTSSRYQVNKSRMVRVAEYSRLALDELNQVLDLPYEGRCKGTLQVFRDPRQIAAADKDIQVLEAFGVPYRRMSVAECIQQEPGLAKVQDKICGGLHLPQDQTGDCFLFTQALAQKCAQAGVRFLYDTQIQALEYDQHSIHGVCVQDAKGQIQKLTADQYVVALGCYSVDMLAPLGLRLPIYPVKGYSLTFPLLDDAHAPQSTLMDETYKVAITRFDQRVRVAGMAELANFDLSLNPQRRKTLEKVIQDLFPQAVDISQGEYWCGLRPMTPDSTPIIGGTQYKNLFLNTGHGTLGWTMSCGSSRYLADVISGQPLEIDREGLDLSRYALVK
ncbi:D-amino-acid dehydrogenase [Allopseudospirillum japonicum]|uniref:D-amino-acid dehydrogenase n=1 Tax=Allopseudospirillum japonicum TaxID=64971 RepID=A0A1H6Q5U2_9GAMM|nr:D-amino-acid dehydrogenase [Allopseudospirillum japonicum]